MSILALNITPYITSSIIMQLLTIAIPKLEEMQKEGEDGRKKIAAITRYVTVGLALIESSAMAAAFWNGNLLKEKNVLSVITVIAALPAVSADSNNDMTRMIRRRQCFIYFLRKDRRNRCKKFGGGHQHIVQCPVCV